MNHIELKQPFCSRGLIRKQQEAAVREHTEQTMKAERSVQTVQSQPKNRLALPASQYFAPPNPTATFVNSSGISPSPYPAQDPLPLNDIDLDEEMLRACEGIEQEILRERSQTESASPPSVSGTANSSRYFTSQKPSTTQTREVSLPGSAQTSPQKMNSVMKTGLRSMLGRKVVKNREAVDYDSSFSSAVADSSSLLGTTQVLKRPFSQDIYDLTLPEPKLYHSAVCFAS